MTLAAEPDQRRGLSAIPPEVEALLPTSLVGELRLDGHGLSFPEPSGCQLRLIRQGDDLGGFYSYKQCGGAEKAIRMAMSRCKQLRIAHPKVAHSPKDFVHWFARYDKRKDKTEYGYRVYYNDGTRQRVKTFSFGHQRPSTSKQLHGFLTARLFHHFYLEYGTEIVEHFAWFQPWKEVRLYYPDRPYFNWKEL